MPEGFFKSPQRTGQKTGIRGGSKKGDREPESLDLKVLEKRLDDSKTFINAEMLLKENYPLCLEQVEDGLLYNVVRGGIQKLVNCGDNSGEYLVVKSELDYLQDRRTAAMLQKVPDIIQGEFNRGNIQDRKAFLTIGLNHISNIIRYLNEKRITISSPPFASIPCEDYNAELNLAKENFGVFIVLPRTLLEDQQALRINGLGKMVMDSRNPSSTEASVSSR